MTLSNIPTLKAFIENLEEVGFGFDLPSCTEVNSWTVQGYPAIVITYQDKCISVYYGQEKDPFWSYQSPDEKTMLRGTIEVVRKLRRMGYKPEWFIGDEELFLKMNED